MSEENRTRMGSDATDPEYTMLFDVAKEMGEEMVLEFRGRVGATPYVRWTDDGWEGVSVGVWEYNEDNNAIISAKELDDVDDEFVMALLEEGPIVELVWFGETPFNGFEPVEYGENTE